MSRHGGILGRATVAAIARRDAQDLSVLLLGAYAAWRYSAMLEARLARRRDETNLVLAHVRAARRNNRELVRRLRELRSAS